MGAQTARMPLGVLSLVVQGALGTDGHAAADGSSQ